MSSTSLLHWISRARWNFSPLFLLCGKDGLLIKLVIHEDRFPEVRCQELCSPTPPCRSCRAEPAPGNQQDPRCFNTRAPDSKQEKQREMFIHTCLIKQIRVLPMSQHLQLGRASVTAPSVKPLHNGGLNPNMLLLSLSLTLCSYISHLQMISL